MISVEESRKILGKIGQDMTDEEIVKLNNALCAIIESVLDDCFEQENKSKRKVSP